MDSAEHEKREEEIIRTPLCFFDPSPYLILVTSLNLSTVKSLKDLYVSFKGFPPCSLCFTVCKDPSYTRNFRTFVVTSVNVCLCLCICVCVL